MVRVGALREKTEKMEKKTEEMAQRLTEKKEKKTDNGGRGMTWSVGTCRSFNIVEYMFYSKRLSRACGSTFQISVLGLLTPLTNHDPKLGRQCSRPRGLVCVQRTEK